VSRWKRIAAVLGVISGMSFALFIIEEGLQVLMFSMWAGKDVTTETRQQIVDLYAGATIALKAVNWTIGIFVPPMFIAYDLYARDSDLWVKAQVEGYNLRLPIPNLVWVQDLLYSVFALIALTVLVLVLRREVAPRAAAVSLSSAQLRDTKKGGGKR
jgi:hypothetical protein